MRLNFSFFILAVFLFSYSARADFVSLSTTLSSFSIRTENLGKENLQIISENFEITSSSGTELQVIVPSNRISELMLLAPFAHMLDSDISSGPRSRIIEQDLRQKLFPHLPSRKKSNPLVRDVYHSITEIQSLLKDFQKNYPDLVEYFEYGTSPLGHPFMGIKISDNVTIDEPEPELMLTAATHGDEIITTEVLIGLIENLLAGYKTAPRLAKMVNDHELFFIPVLNADGFSSQWRYDGMTDPNRSYPYPENPSALPSPSIEAVIDFFQKRDIVGSLDFHAYGRLVMFPWAYSREHITQEDYNMFDLLTTSMAAPNVYTHGPIAEVIYVAKGSSADYYYWQKKTVAVAIEVGLDKAPPVEQIENYTAEQIESTWRFIENF
jgi:hypothetical protein